MNIKYLKLNSLFLSLNKAFLSAISFKNKIFFTMIAKCTYKWYCFFHLSRANNSEINNDTHR